jgi:hypothetical protein
MQKYDNRRAMQIGIDPTVFDDQLASRQAGGKRSERAGVLRSVGGQGRQAGIRHVFVAISSSVGCPFPGDDTAAYRAAAASLHSIQSPAPAVLVPLPANVCSVSLRIVKSTASRYFIPPSHMHKAQNALPKQGPFATVRALCSTLDAQSICLR